LYPKEIDSLEATISLKKTLKMDFKYMANLLLQI
jgi:hypothetical protein